MSRLQYEHMFCRDDIARLKSHPIRMLDSFRAFLLLEDDYDVDWGIDGEQPSGVRTGHREVAWEEPDPVHGDQRHDAPEDFGSIGVAMQRRTGWNEHPHRMMLRSSLRSRRAGTVVPDEQVCLCPVERGQERRRAALRAARLSK